LELTIVMALQGCWMLLVMYNQYSIVQFAAKDLEQWLGCSWFNLKILVSL